MMRTAPFPFALRRTTAQARVAPFVASLGLLISSASMAADSDLDGLDDEVDNCVEFFNPHQVDAEDCVALA